MQVSNLTNEQLDRYAAIAQGWKIVMWGDKPVWVQADGEGRFRCNVADWKPSTNWAQAGPTIEREEITYVKFFDKYLATHHGKPNPKDIGDTPLIAAIRCFVASRLGEELPDE